MGRGWGSGEAAGESLSPDGDNMLSIPISCKYTFLCESWGYFGLEYSGQQTFFLLFIYIILCHYFIWFVPCLTLLIHHSSAASPTSFSSTSGLRLVTKQPLQPPLSLCSAPTNRGLPTSALSTPTGASPPLHCYLFLSYYPFTYSLLLFLELSFS